MRKLLFLIVFSLPTALSAQDVNGIDHFVVKENLIKNGKLAIIATDAEEHPKESVTGTYQFVINGFKQSLNFNEGVAITPNAIETSTFVFLKHRNQQGSHGRLYYVWKTDKGLNPIAINWYYLILVPVAILMVAYLFKRLMILAIVALVGLIIFNYSKGLDIENFIDTIIHGIQDLI